MARPATDLRQRILTAARQAFAARGVDATPLRAIAKTAGTTIGMVYYYYPSKDDLYFAVVEEVYARVLQQFAAVMTPAGEGPTPSFRDRLRTLMRHLAELSAEDRQVVAIVLREVTVSTARRQRLQERFSRGHIPLVMSAVLRAQAAGELRADLHPAMLVFATAALSAMSTLLLEHAPLPGLPRGEARIEATLELLFSGLTGAAAPPSAATAAAADAPPGRGA